MDNSIKKIQERIWLDKFLKKYGNGLQDMGITASETPDFILQSEGKKISIEVTSVTVPAIREREALEEKIVQRAKEKFNQKYTDRLYVLVTFFSYPFTCKTKEIDSHADELYRFVEEAYQTLATNDTDYSAYRERYGEGLFESIDINKDRFDHWQPFGAFSVKNIGLNWLQTIITEKGNNLKKYAARFDENWLLIISDLGHESSTHTYSFDTSNLTISFDHAFIYKWMEDKIIQLK